MSFALALFYLFGAILLASSLAVILVRNPVHAALFLVLSFVTAAGLWLLLYAEFLAITIESEQRDDGTRRTTRYDIDLVKCIYCGFCEESCPVDSIVETDMHEFHFESREETVYTKSMLLAIGDKYEKQIAEARAADAAFR